MELAVASRLRPLAPEHRAHAPNAQPPLAQQPVRDHRARDAGGRFGPQRDVILALIDEAEHLLLDDVGEIADRALEQLRLLDDRAREIPRTRSSAKTSRVIRSRMLPRGGLRRQHIVNAAQGLDDLAQGISAQPCGDVRCAIAAPLRRYGRVGRAAGPPSAPASKRATSPVTNCGPIATARSLISSCTPLGESQVHPQRRHAGDRLHAVGAAVAGE